MGLAVHLKLDRLYFVVNHRSDFFESLSDRHFSVLVFMISMVSSSIVSVCDSMCSVADAPESPID